MECDKETTRKTVRYVGQTIGQFLSVQRVGFVLSNYACSRMFTS